MNSKEIRFANEFCFTAILEEAKTLIKLGLVDYQVLQEDFFMKSSMGKFVRVAIAREERMVFSRLKLSYGRALLRADKITGKYIELTLLEFSENVAYDDENPLMIIVDQAIAADLRVNNIQFENAADKIKQEVLVEENGKHAFAYTIGKEDGALERIGDRYTFTICETPQHYLHIVQIRKRTNKNRIDFPIVLLSGAIEIVNEIHKETPIVIIDMHAEATSEKMALAAYLDGKISALLGTHTHVQTADERIMPKGTAYISDVGMCGPESGIIGASAPIIIKKFTTGMPQRFEPATADPMINAVVLTINPDDGKTQKIVVTSMPQTKAVVKANFTVDCTLLWKPKP